MSKLKIFTPLLVLLFSVLLLSGCGKKGTDVEITDKSPVHLKYDVSGKDKGTLDLYYKGKSVKMEIVSTGEQAANVVMYVKDEMLYMVMDMAGQKMGIKSSVKDDKDFKEFSNMINVKDKLKDMKKSGTDEVLGYKCDVYESDKDGKVSVYKEMVPLKMISKKVTMPATLFEPNASFKDDMFEPPKDIEFKSESDLQNMFNGQQ
jgi:hypothetical protein